MNFMNYDTQLHDIVVDCGSGMLVCSCVCVCLNANKCSGKTATTTTTTGDEKTTSKTMKQEDEQTKQHINKIRNTWSFARNVICSVLELLLSL